MTSIMEHDNNTEDITITANMRIESISTASNDNTQCLYTQPIYIPEQFYH